MRTKDCSVSFPYPRWYSTIPLLSVLQSTIVWEPLLQFVVGKSTIQLPTTKNVPIVSYSVKAHKCLNSLYVTGRLAGFDVWSHDIKVRKRTLAATSDSTNYLKLKLITSSLQLVLFPLSWPLWTRWSKALTLHVKRPAGFCMSWSAALHRVRDLSTSTWIWWDKSKVMFELSTG